SRNVSALNSWFIAYSLSVTRSEIELEARSLDAGNTDHDLVAGLFFLVGEVVVAMLERAVAGEHRRLALTARATPAEIRRLEPCRLEGLQDALVLLDAHGFRRPLERDVEGKAAARRGEVLAVKMLARPACL